MSRGRPQRPYQTSWGELVPGLYHCPDGRWRIVATGKRFTEPDERMAVAKFRQWDAENAGDRTIAIPQASASLNDIAALTRAINSLARPQENLADLRGNILPPELLNLTREQAPAQPIRIELNGQTLEFFSIPMQADAFWLWLSRLITCDPQRVAKMTGIPGLAHIEMPRPSPTLKDLLNTYKQHNPSHRSGSGRAAKFFERFIDEIGAATLDDMTEEKLSEWRNKIETSTTITSSQTKRWMYGQIKAVLAFQLKCPGTDTKAIREALDRCKILWTADPLPAVQPNPISREDFHKLLKQAGDSLWRPWLLLGLNLCLHMDEVCGLKWDEFDMDHGTYVCIRQKTRRQRIPRAAILWDETKLAMAQIPRRGQSPYVFVSKHGTRFSKNSQINKFKTLREEAGIPDDITFDSIRDGAYGAALKGSEEKWARVLSGHRAPGLLDNYVLRCPECVRPACEAVYAAYGPFPS